MKPPEFWNHAEGRDGAPMLRTLLSPLGWAYGALTRRRIRRAEPFDAGVPVVCVGNATVGGTGKTPVALYLLHSLRRLGIETHALSRGHGGVERGPVEVTHNHSALEVGDEPLLLATAAPTWVSHDRASGARVAVAHGAKAIVMDDGHQNPDLRKSLSLLVVDAETGFGNGRILPAGPLRERVTDALARADAAILMMPGPDYDPAPELVAQLGNLPVIPAWLSATAAAPPGPLHAFAGIGRPDKFFDTVRRIGGTVVEQTAFADHHRYRPEELATLALMARERGATLITTDKDYVRLPTGFRRAVHRLPVEVQFGDELTLRALLHPVIEKARR